MSIPRRRAAEKSPAAIALPSALPVDAIAAARDICERFGGGVRQGGGVPAVAVKMGVSAGVLYHKLTADDEAHHKLTVRDCILIFLVTGEVGHLQALARVMNCVAFQVPDFTGLSDQALLDLVCKLNEEAGQFHGVLGNAIADGKIDAGEYRQLRREAYEWIGAIVEADRRLEGMVTGG